MQNLSVFLLITFVTILTPGAGVLFTVSTALRNGMRAPWQAPLGNAVGSTAISVVCAAGVGAVITASPVLFTGMQVVSALVLLWLGLRAWNAPATGFASLAREGEGAAAGVKASASSRSSLSIVLSAMALQATNPMLYVYVLSLLPQFIDPKGGYASQASLLIGIFGVSVLVIHLGYSFLAAWARRFLSSPRAAKAMNRISGGLFLLLGASVMLEAARTHLL